MSYHATTSPPPRCSSCYRPAPFHTKKCSYAAAASLHPDAPPPSPYQQAQLLSSISTSASDPPAYSQTQHQRTAPNVVYEQRRRVRGPIGYAVRWGVEKVREEHDKKKWKAQQVGTERVDGSSMGPQSISDSQETGRSGSRTQEFRLVQSEEDKSRVDEKR